MAIGCFTMLSSGVGYLGSRFRPVFLTLYLVVGTFATTLQLTLVLGIFAAQDRVAAEIEAADSISGAKHFDSCATRALCGFILTLALFIVALQRAECTIARTNSMPRALHSGAGKCSAAACRVYQCPDPYSMPTALHCAASMQGVPGGEAGGGQVDVPVGGAGGGRQPRPGHGHALHGRPGGQVRCSFQVSFMYR